MPHGHCYLWRPDILFLHAFSDSLIAISYFIIPICLIFIIKKRTDIPIKKLIILFILFIVFCGMTHILELISIWIPIYYTSGIIKLLTAIVSVATVIAIYRAIPKILSFPQLTKIEDRLKNDMFIYMDQLPIGIITTNIKGEIFYTNKNINFIFGYSEEELIGKSVEVLLPEALVERHLVYKEEYLNAPYDKQMGAGRILTGLTKDGEEISLEIGLKPLNEISGETHILVSIKDVTKEVLKNKILDQSNEILKIATSEIPSSLAYIDQKGFFKFANKSFLKNWEIELEDLIGTHVQEHLTKKFQKILGSNISKVLNGERISQSINIEIKDHESKYFDIFYIPHFDSDKKNVLGIVFLAHNITTNILNKKEVERKNKQREDYAFLVLHDLRAPVRYVYNFSEQLKTELLNKYDLDDRNKKYLDIIYNNAVKTQTMISGMLKIASLDSVNPKFINTNLNQFITTHFKENYEQQPLNFIIAPSKIEYSIDHDLFSQMLQNLVDNSIIPIMFKYTGRV